MIQLGKNQTCAFYADTTIGTTVYIVFLQYLDTTLNSRDKRRV